MPTRRTVIQKITLNSNVSDVIFSGIPQHYSSLKIIASARSTWPGSGLGGFFMEFNGSSGGGAGYKMAYIGRSGTNSSGGSYTTNATYPGSFLRYVPSVGGTASTFSDVEINIPNYTSSNYKTYSSTVIAEQNSASMSSAEVASVWNNTAPITQIKLWVGQPDNTGTEPYSKFVAGSTFYLYGITHVPIINGGEVSIRNGYKIHTFRNTASMQVVEGGQVEYLVVAGGGAGGSYYSGGGGAGGYRSSVSGENSGGGSVAESKLMVAAGMYTMTVGAGGAGVSGYSPEFYGNNGSNSTFSSITSIGGGGGAYYIINDTSTGRDGGSGGGGGAAQARYGVSRPGGAGTANQGYAGGSGNRGDANNEYGSGGGGGAGGTGGNSDGNTGSAGAGGAGVASSITGFSTTRAGGGGGVTSLSNAGAAGGSGGGGAGGINGVAGVANTGGGGGGCLAGTSGNGGSGIVVIRYPYDGN